MPETSPEIKREAGQTPDYEHYSPEFYARWEDDPITMAKASEANSLTTSYLFAFGVSEIWELPHELQDFLNNKAKIEINLGDYA